MTEFNDLFERAKKQEPDAINELLDLLRPIAERYAHSKRSQAHRWLEDTVDIVQQVLFDFSVKLPKVDFSNETACRSYVLKAIENRLRSQHNWMDREKRAQNRGQRVATGFELQGDKRFLNDQDGALTDLGKRERIEKMKNKVQSLPSADQELLRLRDTEGETWPTIAKKMDVSADAARQRYNRIIQALHGQLRESP